MKKIFGISYIIFFLLSDSSLSGQESQDKKTKLFPDENLFPAMLVDPDEPQSYISFTKLNKGDILDYDVYIPFAFGFRKGIVQWGMNNVSLDFASHTQFGWRREKNINPSGLRKSLINIDYMIGGSYNVQLNENLYARLRLFHRSSHLGDDYILLDSINPHGYWENDESNYEQSDITILYKYKTIKTYGGVGYVLSPSTPRKRLSFQLGATVSDFSNPRLRSLVMGFDMKVLENNFYNPNLKCAAGIKFYKEKPFYLLAEYYTGHIPYSRFESSLIINWIGIGIYLGSPF